MTRRGCLLLFLLTANTIGAFDNYHFYQANRLLGEPRFERPFLTSFDVFCGGGSALQSRNCAGNKTPLFNIYGSQDLQHLAEGLSLNPEDPTNQLLIQLNALPDNGDFGKVLFGGSVTLHEAIFDFCQNFKHGFYGQIFLPVRSFHIQPTLIRDLSPSTGFPNAQDPLWRTLLFNLDSVLRHYDLSIAGNNKRWFGDLCLALGWTKNYQETEYFDFVDGNLVAGIIVPTDKTAEIYRPFDLSTGHNHHWGGSITGRGAIGLWEWLSIGGTAGALFLASRTSMEHIKTGAQQSGFIKIGQGNVTNKPGIYWHLGVYAKADHFSEFFSFLLGYSFTRRERDHVHLNNNFSPAAQALANDSGSLLPWYRHTLHVQFEFDFADEQRRWHPHIYFSYDHPVGGARIFQLSVGGATFGIDVTWPGY